MGTGLMLEHVWQTRPGTSRRARRLTTTPPAMTLAEAIDAIHTHSTAGLTGDRTAS
jgi:hypothetical protein